MLSHGTLAKQAATNAVTALVTKCLITDASDNVLATFTGLTYGTADANGKATLNAVSAVAATGTGTAAKAKFVKTDLTVVYQGSCGIKYAIAAVSQGSKTFRVDGVDLSSVAYGQTLTISGSTGNDGTYTVVSATYGGGNTTFTVHEAIPNATADGALLPYDLTINNTSINGPPNAQQVAIVSHDYTCQPT